MAPNGIHSAQEGDILPTTQESPQLRPSRSKSYDNPDRESTIVDHAHVQQRPRLASLKRQSSAHGEAQQNAWDQQQDTIRSTDIDRIPQQEDPAERQGLSELAMPNGNAEGACAPLEQSVSSVDHGENPANPGLVEHPQTEQYHQSTNIPSNLQISARPASPLAVDGTPAGLRSHPPLPPEEENDQPELCQTKDTQAIESNLLEPDTADLNYEQTPGEFATSDQIQMEAETSLPVQQETGYVEGHNSKEALETSQGEGDIETFAKKLRRLQKRIDTVLTKRTELRNERETLENLRRFLFESTNELITAMQAQQQRDAPQRNTKAKKKKKRKKKSTKNDEAIAQVPLSNERLESTDSGVVTTETNPDVAGSGESATTVNSLTNLTTLFERCLDDFEALRKQEEYEKKLMDDLSSREFQLDNLQGAVLKNMQSAKFSAELRTEMLHASSASSESSVKAESEEDLPPLVEKFFDHTGNIGIYLERLQDLDYYHQEGLQERDFLRDRGDELPVPDADFESGYQVKRAEIEENLKKEREQAETMANLCAEDGINPEMYRNTARSPYSGSPALAPRLVTKSLMPFEQTSVPLRQHHALSPTARGQSSLQIEGWLREVPDDLDLSQDTEAKP